jgi:hypothetical protein
VWQKSNETSNTASDRPHRICSSRTNCQLSYFIKTTLEEKGSFAWDQTLQTNGCSIITTPYVTLPSSSQNFLTQKVFLWSPSTPFTWPQPLWHFFFFLNLKISSNNVISESWRPYRLQTSTLLPKVRKRFHRCLAAQGNYFEGDYIDVWKK